MSFTLVRVILQFFRQFLIYTVRPRLVIVWFHLVCQISGTQVSSTKRLLTVLSSQSRESIYVLYFFHAIWT